MALAMTAMCCLSIMPQQHHAVFRPDVLCTNLAWGSETVVKLGGNMTSNSNGSEVSLRFHKFINCPQSSGLIVPSAPLPFRPPCWVNGKARLIVTSVSTLDAGIPSSIPPCREYDGERSAHHLVLV